MYYVSIKAARDFLAFAEETLKEPNGALKANTIVTSHGEAKWIINKLKHVVKRVEAAQQVTEETIKVPITDGVLDCILSIQTIAGEQNG